LDILANELDLSVSLVLILLKIGERYGENSAFESFRSDFSSNCLVYRGLSDGSVRELDRGSNIEPLLLEERVDDFLLSSFSLLS